MEAAVFGGELRRSRLPVENMGDDDLWIFVEPYGEDYWLKPGDVFTVAPEVEGIDVWFSTAVCPEGITVWLYEDGDPTKVVLKYTVSDADGTRLECGHQRPPKPAGWSTPEPG
ncbi:hypothetical protein SGR_390 [Streptomyces griseus subsp. griseus NBRC 13350]|uniref:Uncharacterized protein n=2 Tax=Streptomyces TaxID=1883 RepID=B1VQB8_STRGG|nr:hypothetical protein [Streptomyces griseus]BAG17219.1 hypothetical protein SGR_390 [Streptomyces griseus subsp. griseus NBRC 13350]SED78613.1 hypothetical protein SAMN04490359_1884 [Streptomyces griseus]SQA21000.1 Uncharacterised protein [Streptomyces griseus]